MNPKVQRFFDRYIQPYKKHLIAFGVILLLVSVGEIFYLKFHHPDQESDYEDYFNPENRSLSIQLPKNMDFADEKVPLKDHSFRTGMEKELVMNTYWNVHSTFLHRRASRWFPVIEPILKKNGIPDDFKYLAVVESQLTNVISAQGATGFWQLIGSTASGYGLEIDGEVDERYQVALATQAACKYFKEAYEVFHNWTLVAASYNLGIGGIQAQLKKQEKENFFELQLPAETRRYLFKILAAKEILGRPKIYGYELKKQDRLGPLPCRTILIDSTIHDLNAFARQQGIDITILKSYNPWLISSSLSAKPKKRYQIQFPPKGFAVKNLEEILQSETIKTEKDTVFSPKKGLGKDSSLILPGNTPKEGDNI